MKFQIPETKFPSEQLSAIINRTPDHEGGTRTVWVEGDFVVKTIHNMWDESDYRGEENLIEAAIWNKYKDTKFAKYFAPVIDVAKDGSWLVMAFAKTCERERTLMDGTEWFGFEEVLWDLGIQDQCEFNAGRIDGNLVSIDYATINDILLEELNI